MVPLLFTKAVRFLVGKHMVGSYVLNRIGLNRCYSRTMLNDGNTAILMGGVGSGIILPLLYGYVRRQLEVSSLLGKIPANSTVVELYPQDTKNVYYLPQGCKYTAVVEPTDDAKFKSQLASTISQLNRNDASMRGTTVIELGKIQPGSVDCIITTGTLSEQEPKGERLQRTSSQERRVSLIKQSYRLLKVGAAMLFVEPKGDGTLISLLKEIFESLKPSSSTASSGLSRQLPRRAMAKTAAVRTGRATSFTLPSTTENENTSESTDDLDIEVTRGQAVDDEADASMERLRGEGAEPGSTASEPQAARAEVELPAVPHNTVRFLFRQYLVGAAIKL